MRSSGMPTARANWRRLVAVAGLCLLGAGTASAQWKVDTSVEYWPPRKLLPWVPIEAGLKYVKREPEGPLLVVISLGTQSVDIYDRKGLVASAPVSSGRSDYETPEGVFSIIEKREEHFSNLYDDAHMPFMQRLTWSGIALHQGPLPGHAASHGCIRLPGGFAEWLFRRTRLNTRVVVTPHRPRPVEIAHPTLLESMTTAVIDDARPPAATATKVAEAASAASGTPLSDAARAQVIDLKSIKAARKAAFQAAEDTLAKARAAEAAHAQAQKAVKDAKAAAETATKAFRTAHAAMQRADDRAGELARAADRARGAAADRARLAATKAEEQVKAAREAADAAEVRAVDLADAARKAEDAVKTADEAKVAAWLASRTASRAAAPVSVLVSRARSRIYLRQNFEPLGEIAFDVKDPKLPIGTHVFKATGYAEDGERLLWTATTVEDPSFPKRRASTTTGRLGPLTLSERIDLRQLAEAAIDRVPLPPEVLARIAPALQPGSSIIITDRSPSSETGKGTDFVILTNPEPDFWVQAN